VVEHRIREFSASTVRLCILGAVVTAILVRAPGLNREITHDEAYSWLGFASISYAHIFTDYKLPNNHILHSAAMRLASQLLDGHQEWVLRAPAFIAGVAAVPVSAGLATAALGSPIAGVIAAWWVALHPAHVNYSQTARGYSMLALFAALSCWAGLQAVGGGHPILWGAAASAAFLSAWTLPSGAFLLAGLGGWSVFEIWRRRRTLSWPALLAVASGFIALGAAYLPVWEQLQGAAARWGIKVWTAPANSLDALLVGGNLLAGGNSIFAGLALLGCLRLLRRREGLALLVASLILVPIAAALLTGVAGQPRSYFYLLPVSIVCASAWIQEPRTRIRQIGGILFALGIGSLAWEQWNRSSAQHGYANLSTAFEARPPSEVLMAPFFLDVPLEFYTRKEEGTRLRRVLADGNLDAVLFTVGDVDSRASFASYNLFYDERLYEIALPEVAFTEVYRGTAVRLLGLQEGRRLYPTGETSWNLVKGDGGLRLIDPVFGTEPGTGVVSNTDFTAFESVGFAVPVDGLVAVNYARRGAHMTATLCAQVGDVWEPQVAYSGQTIALTAIDEENATWVLENRIILTQPDQRYAVCLTGMGPGERYVADLLYTYFPLSSQ
jgi:hypothetical protein